MVQSLLSLPIHVDKNIPDGEDLQSGSEKGKERRRKGRECC